MYVNIVLWYPKNMPATRPTDPHAGVRPGDARKQGAAGRRAYGHLEQAGGGWFYPAGDNIRGLIDALYTTS